MSTLDETPRARPVPRGAITLLLIALVLVLALAGIALYESHDDPGPQVRPAVDQPMP
jgi:hypothetical protein